MRFWGKMKMFRDLHFCPHLLLNAPFRDMPTKSNNLRSYCFICLDTFHRWTSNFGKGTFHARIFGNSAITPFYAHTEGIQPAFRQAGTRPALPLFFPLPIPEKRPEGSKGRGQFFTPCPVRLTVDSKTSVGHHSYEACNQRSGGSPSHPVQSG